MFRNEYDDSVATWSPQGRIHQIEYAEEAIKHGSATLGLKSQTHVALVALERVLSDLSIHQKKILTIDSHVGISMAGLTADARVLSKFMQTECSNSRSIYETPLRVSHLVAMVGSKTHMDTQCAAGRPLGVGLLVAGYDEDGSHLYQACPSVNFLDCKAMAIGARSQPARTYLERHLDEFPKCNSEELIKHGLRALRDTLQKNVILTSKNCSVALVGEGTPFTIYEDEHIDQYLKLIEDEERSAGAGKDDKPTQMDGDPGSGAGPDAQASTSDTSDQ